MSSIRTARFKTSIFVNFRGARLIHDLSNRSYEVDGVDCAILQSCSEADASLQILRQSIQHPDLEFRCQRLLDSNLLVLANCDETSHFFPHRVDIETCRQCNARCQYCPQSISSKAYGVMPMEVFEVVLNRLSTTALRTQQGPQWVALNHYNEPLLDPYFMDRVTLLRAKHLPLRLFTNATLMTDSLVQFLCRGGLRGMVFNFPSLEIEEWCQFMQLPETLYWQARRGIENFIATHHSIENDTTIVVNGLTKHQTQRVERIKNHFSTYGSVRVEGATSHSRAGMLNNALVQRSEHYTNRKFAGCKRIAAHLHVSWKGKVFLCCQDYGQRVILGDLRLNTLASIMGSEQTRQLRAELYGLKPMQSSRLCLKCPMLREERFPVNPEVLPDCEFEVASELPSPVLA